MKPSELLDKENCVWIEEDDGDWRTTCGEFFILIADTPKANSYNFCPSCGKKLIQREAAKES